jgi:hypothetical protein
MRSVLGRTRLAENVRRLGLIPDGFVFMGSSSFNAVESTRFAVRAITGELISLSFAMSRTSETERVPPSVRGSIFEVSITREFVEPAGAAPAVICAKRVDRVAHADEGGSRLANTRTVALSHAQDGNGTEHSGHDQDRPDSPEHEQAA